MQLHQNSAFTCCLPTLAPTQHVELIRKMAGSIIAGLALKIRGASLLQQKLRIARLGGHS